MQGTGRHKRSSAPTFWPALMSPPGGGGQQPSFSVEVGRVKTFFSSEPPGAGDDRAQYFAEVSWLAAPMLPARSRGDGEQPFYPRCSRSGLPVVFTDHYRQHASAADGFLTPVQPLQMVLPLSCFLAPLDEHHDVPAGLRAPADDHVDCPIDGRQLELYGCNGRRGHVPGAANDPAVIQSWQQLLTRRRDRAGKRARAPPVRPGRRVAQRTVAGRRHDPSSSESGSGSDSGSDSDADEQARLATPLLSTVIVPYFSLYAQFL